MFAADLREISVTCPHCGEVFVTAADPSVEDQEYVEDCQVCCSPIVMHLHIDWATENIRIETQRENH